MLTTSSDHGRQADAVRGNQNLNILFLVSAHNSLSQRIYIALTELGHKVTVEVVTQGHEMEAAVAAHKPELIVCPFLKAFIPESIWKGQPCLVVHPGPHGDRGPSSLDWAVELGMDEWGVTLLEAAEEADAGDIWATRKFPHARDRQELAVPPRGPPRRGPGGARGDEQARPARLQAPGARLQRPERDRPPAPADEAAGPRDRLEQRLDRPRAAQDPRRRGLPGVLDTIEGVDFFLFGAHVEKGLRGRPGAIIATRHGAICRATVDGASGSRTSSSATPSSCRPRARWSSAASRTTRRSCRSPSTPRSPPGPRSGRSGTRSAAPSATCTSTSTTAR